MHTTACIAHIESIKLRSFNLELIFVELISTSDVRECVCMHCARNNNNNNNNLFDNDAAFLHAEMELFNVSTKQFDYCLLLVNVHSIFIN